MENERGIFGLSVFKKIIDKIIYLEKYPHLDENMSDSNIGARRKKNIKNHLFIIYAQWSYSRKCPLPRISKTKVKTFWLISPEPEVQKSIVNIQDDGIVVQILKMVNFFSNNFFFYFKKKLFRWTF